MPILKSLIMLVAVAACLTLSAGCAPAEEEPATNSPGASSESKEMGASASTTDASLASESEPGGITAESLTGTTWAIADYSVSFEADGVVSFNSGSKGTWSLSDKTITIAAAGEETVITIEGDKLMLNGMALEQQS